MGFVLLCMILLIYTVIVFVTAYKVGKIDGLNEDPIMRPQDQVVTIVCTSETRQQLKEPYLWMNVYETDTGKYFIWTGHTWHRIEPLQQTKGRKSG